MLFSIRTKRAQMESKASRDGRAELMKALVSCNL